MRVIFRGLNFLLLGLVFVSSCLPNGQASVPSIDSTEHPKKQVPSIEEYRNLLLGTDGCYPPCVLGVTPGETNADDALANLSGYDFVFDLERTGLFAFMDRGLITWDVSIDGSRMIGEAAYSLTDAEATIQNVRLDFPNTDLDFLIGSLGEPEYIYVRSGVIDVDAWGMDLIWLSKGVGFRVGGASPYPEIIKGDLILNAVDAYFYVPLQTALEEVRSKELILQMVGWEGYRPFEYYLRK